MSVDTAKLKTELTTDTDKAVLDVRKASDKMSQSLGKVTGAAKQTHGETDKIGKSLDKGASSSVKFMASMEGLNKAASILKSALDLGNEYVKFAEMTGQVTEQTQAFKDLNTGISDAKLMMGQFIVDASYELGQLGIAIYDVGTQWKRAFLGGDDSGYNIATQAIRGIERKLDKIRRDKIVSDDEDYYLYTKGARTEDTSGPPKEKAKAGARSTTAERDVAGDFMRQYNDLQNDPRLRNARVDGILDAEPGGNLDGIIADADAEDARREERNRLATEDAQAAYEAAQINAQATEAEVEGIRSKISAAVEFMKMDRARKVQWLKDTGTEEAIKAGAYLGEALFFTATGNPAAAGLYAAAAQHAAVAVACGVGAAAMGSGRGGGTGASGAAGGGYSRPSASGGGGNSTIIVNVHDSIVDSDRLAGKIQDALIRGQSSGAVRKASSVRGD